QLLVQNKFLGKFELVLVCEGSGADDLVEPGSRAIFTVARRGRAERVSVAVFPLAVPVFFSASLRRTPAVEIAHPLGKIGTVIRGGDPVAAFGIDPVGGISGESGGQYGRAIFQRDREHSGFAA